MCTSFTKQFPFNGQKLNLSIIFTFFKNSEHLWPYKSPFLLWSKCTIYHTNLVLNPRHLCFSLLCSVMFCTNGQHFQRWWRDNTWELFKLFFFFLHWEIINTQHIKSSDPFESKGNTLFKLEFSKTNWPWKLFYT